jgi:pimeloyl-ACP methyl ester carboxylesterase
MAETAEITAETFRLADGTPINLVRTGDRDASMIVLLAHGYALDHRSWRRVARELPAAVGEIVQVVAYDHRGHGGSGPANEETATIERLGDDMAELIEGALPEGRVVVVGHSMGGMAAMALVERHPRLFHRRVTGLVFVSSALRRPAENSLAWPQAVGRLVQGLENIFGRTIVQAVRDRIDSAKTAGLRWWLFGRDPREEDVRLTADMVRAHWPGPVALFRPALDRYDRRAALTAAEGTPVIAVVGDEDRLVPASYAKVIVKGVGSGDGVLLRGAGHMLPLERPKELAEQIAKLARATAAS